MGKYTKIILQYTLDGVLLKEWLSIKSAAVTLGLNRGHISSCCGHHRKTTGGYKWEFKV